MQITERREAETAREYAYRVLRDNIIHLTLEPGAAVSEKELAEELGVSRTPVREALMELAKSNIVEIYPQRGCVISKIDLTLVEEVRFLRLVLEKAVVEAACDPTAEYDLTSLRENVRLQEYYLDHPVTPRLLELDDAFHRALFQITGKKRIHALMLSMTPHFDRLRNVSVRTVADRGIICDHRAILQAIEEKNASEALKVMAHHLSRYKAEESEMRAQNPAYFAS